jgi:bacillithiol biosynthesis cysteine-adding enzyme BshC
VEERPITVGDAPPGFLSRAEFQPRTAPRRGGEPSRWLPEDPFFAPPLDFPPGGWEGTAPPRAAAAGSEILVRLFRSLGEEWEIPWGAEARRNLKLLESPSTRLVIAGQQPGFLTGPLYTAYKAVSAAAAARQLSRRTGVPHLPVFWVASEDHDLDEARSVHLPGPDGSSVEFSLPHAADRRPLSAYPIDRAAEEVLQAAAAHLKGRRESALAEELMSLYRGRNLASGFGAILARTFEKQGLLLVEPERLRPLAEPVFRRALEEPAELMAKIEEGIRLVEGQGISAQVPARFPLFLLVEGKRHHLSPEGSSAGRDGGRFRLEGVGKEYRAAELLELLRSEPARFSAGVLLRPVVQEAVLPAALTIGGPAELSYFAQLRPVFDWFGVGRPRIALRLSATLVEGKLARALRKLELGGDSPGAGERWARASEPADLLPPLAGGPEVPLRSLAVEARERMAKPLADPRIPAVQRRRLAASGEKLAAEMEGLAARAGRAARQSEEEELLLAAKVLRSFFPDRVLQERRWNIFYYLAKYGLDWVSELVETVEADPFRTAHRWVEFTGGEGGGAP